MREHMGLYRGKRRDNGDWGEGYLSKRPSAIQIGAYCPWYISVPPLDPDDNGGYYNVDPDTIGECTGLTDKNGNLIFEGDIVEGLFLFEMAVRAKVAFRDGSFGLIWHRGNVEEFTPFTSTCNVAYKIIGNVADNPELLESEG